LSVRPTNRKVAEQALAELYSGAGLPAPAISWHYSPGAAIRAFARHADRDGPNVWHSIGGLLGDQIWQILWQQIAIDVGLRVWEQMRGTLWHGEGGSPQGTRDEVFSALDGEHTTLHTRRGVEWQQGRTGEYFTTGAWLRELLPTYAFFHEVAGVEGLEQIEPFIRLTGAAGPWFARKRRVHISMRPTHFSLDDQGRLHSESGPAFGYPKGEKQYVWHGVTVPAKVILAPEKITAKQIRSEWNSEVRRVMLERYGLERFLKAGNARTVNRDRYGRLWDLQGDRWVELRNSTAEPDGSHKTYFLRVPPTVDTAHEAVAWTFQMTTDEYRLAAES
jgi:hypothetical protein